MVRRYAWLRLLRYGAQSCSGDFFLFSGSFQNIHSGTIFAPTDATDAKTLVSSTSQRPESNGRRPAPGFGQKLCKTKIELYYFAYPDNPGELVSY